MKLQNLLSEVRYGKEFYENSKSVDEIVESYDADYKKFFVSQRIRKLSEGIAQDQATINEIAKIASLFEEIESREVANKATVVFYKLRVGSLVESHNKIVKKFDDAKYSKTIDRSRFGKMLGAIQYGINEVASEAGVSPSLANTPVLLGESVENELALIQSVVE